MFVQSVTWQRYAPTHWVRFCHLQNINSTSGRTSAMSALTLCDVPADGDCFYTSYVRSALGQLPPNIEKRINKLLRTRVAANVLQDRSVQKMLKSLVVLCKQCKSDNLVEEHPLIVGAQSLSDVADNIKDNKVWASQVEVSIVQQFAAKRKVALIVVEGNTESAADQLMAALDKATMEKCMVLVRMDQCHYQYLWMNGGVFSTAWLIYLAAQMAMLEDPDAQLF